MSAASCKDMPYLIPKEKYLNVIPVHITHETYGTPTFSVNGLNSLHQHQFIEISYICGGNGTHHIWNKAYPAEIGNLYVINTAVPHGFFTSDQEAPLSVRSLYLDPQELFTGENVEIGNENYLFGLFAKNNFAVQLALKGKHLKTISAAFDKIQLETEGLQQDWQIAVRSHVTLLLLQIKRFTERFQIPQVDKELKETALVSDVLQLISEYYAEPDFSLKKVSELLYKNASSISIIFHEVTGKHFSDYLCSYRMQKAVSLLTDTDYTNENIALLCGYCDFPSFYKQFRLIIGVTPREFRNHHKKQDAVGTDTVKKENSMDFLYAEISNKLQQCQKKEVIDLVTRALEEELPPIKILNLGLVDGMNVLGEKFHANKVFAPEVLMAASTMNTCLDILKPHLTEANIHLIGKAVICTVKGDIHDVGKNLVKLMLECEGIQCIDLGVDVDPSDIARVVRTHEVHLVCLSALLTTTIMAMKDVIDTLEKEGLREHVRIMVGGAPVTQEFAESIGADVYTPDAVTAAKEAKRLLLEMENK